jgi:glucose-6-phosphate 1-dehydrogenase
MTTDAAADRASALVIFGATGDLLLQVLASVLADPPDGAAMAEWRDAKSRIIGALRPLSADDVVRGQYEGYLRVAGVAANSATETYVALRTAVDSWRWADVPIVIRAGKCMPLTATEVSIRFRRPPHDVFNLAPASISNVLRFRVWPAAQVGLSLVGKKQSTGWAPQPEELVFAEQPAGTCGRTTG